MGNLFSYTTTLASGPNYKYDRLMALCKIMGSSPADLENLINEKTNIDIDEIVTYRWMGMNLLHFVELHLAVCTNSKLELCNQYIKLRSTIIKNIPKLLDAKTEQLVYLSYNSATEYLNKGTTECRYILPHTIDVIYFGRQKAIDVTLFSHDARKYNILFDSIPKNLTINIGLSRMEFILQLKSVFGRYPMYKDGIVTKFVRKSDIKDQNVDKKIDKVNENFEDQVEGKPNIPGGLNIY
jgi:hypothetical protein